HPPGMLPYVGAPTAVALLDDLARRFPGAGRVIAAHRAENFGDVLPHLEMSRLQDWAAERYRASIADGEEAVLARIELTEFLGRLESEFELGDPRIDEVIANGFLEGLASHGDATPGLVAMLPPKMRK